MKTRNQEVLLNKFISLNDEKIDLYCPICKDLLNQPITLPCSHNFCKTCLETSIKVLCQQCPCCRKRFSNWYRRAVQKNVLVNNNLWQKIREKYGDLIVTEKKTDKLQRFALSELNKNSVKLSQTGEIREEYLKVLEKLKEERKKQQASEEQATQNLILQLYQKEFKISKVHQDNSSMLVAGPSHTYQSCIGSHAQTSTAIGGRGSINKSSTSVITISSTSSPSCSSSMSNNYSLFKSVAAVVTRGTELIKQKVSQRIFTKKYVDQSFSASPSLLYPTKTHKLTSSDCRRDSIESNDSLTSEFRDFKPIRAAPITPKKLGGEILRIPSIRPENDNSFADSSFNTNISSLSPIKRNILGRRSAFSVVSNNVVITSTPKELKSRLVSEKRGTRGYKRKSSSSTASSLETFEKTAVTVIHFPPNKKTKTNSYDSIAAPANTRLLKTVDNRRITRSKSLNKMNGTFTSHLEENQQHLLKQVVLEQEKLEKILQQERNDFEFAKKLQKKLNKAEQEHKRTEYELRKTRGKTKVNGLIDGCKVVTKAVKQNKNISGKKGKEKSTNIKTEELQKVLVLRRSTRKRH